MRLSKASRHQALAPLADHVDAHSAPLERALKGLWKAQQGRSDHEEGYRALTDESGKLGKAWAAATAAGSNAAYARLDAPAQSWIDARARWFVGVMTDQQARTIRAVGAQARDIAPDITPEEIAEYKRLAVGLTERDILAVMRYGATLKAALENKDVRKAILPGAVAEYARRLAASRAATIAATELAAAFNAGKLAAYRMAQGLGLDIGDDEHEDVPDKTEGGQSKRSILREALAGGISADALASIDVSGPTYEKVWVTVDDPCPECEALEGQTTGVDEEFEDGDPPLHANCFPAGTMVSGPRATGSTMRWFEGEIVELSFATGDFLAVTPNHPILTPNGWVAAGALVKGRYVVSSSFSERDAERSSYPDDYESPALIEDIATALGGDGKMISSTMPVSPEDFHGDGEGSEVCVVRADGLLRNGLDAAGFKPETKQLLGGRNPEPFRLSRLCALALLLKRVLSPPYGFMRGLGVALILLGRACSHAQSVSFCRIPGLNAGFPEQPKNGSSRYTVPSRKALRRFSGEIAPNQIVKIQRRPFAGHVYNLQTVAGWYIANSIIVHNCRCSVSMEKTGD